MSARLFAAIAGVCLAPATVFAQPARLTQAPQPAPPSAPAAQAAAPRRCDLQACIEAAVRNHPLLRAGEAQQAEARALLEQRKAEWLPELSMGVGVGYLDGEAVGPTAALRGIDQRPVTGAYWYFGPHIEVPLFAEGSFIGQTSPGRRLGELGVSEKEWTSRALRLQVSTRVAEAYVDVLKAQRALEVNDRLVGMGESAYRLALAQHQQNLISRADLLAAEVRAATARQDLAIAQFAAERARRNLGIAMGLEDASERIEVEDIREETITLEHIDALRVRVRETHPDLKVSEFKVLQSREEVKRAERERWGKLYADLGYAYTDDFDPSGPDQFYALLRYRIPLWDFGRIKERAALNQAKAQNDEQILKSLRLRVERDVSELYYRAGELAARSQLIWKQIAQAEETVKLNRSRHQQGLVSSAVLADSEAALLRLRLEQDTVENDRKLAQVRLKLLSGQ